MRRSLLGASHESSTWATVPDGNSRLMNATSGIVEDASAATAGPGRRLVEPVAEDREVVRAEVPGDADVGLVKAEVHAAGGDEVDLAELAGLIRSRISITGGL